MLKIDLHYVIATLVETLHQPSPEKSRSVKLSHGRNAQMGIMMNFNISMEFPQKRENASYRLHVMACGNCSIFMATSPSNIIPKFRDNVLDNLDWENTCNHVSEWRNSGISKPLFNIYLRKCTEFDSSIAPCYINQHVTFGHGLPDIQTVLISWEYIDDRKYYRQVTGVSRGP